MVCTSHECMIFFTFQEIDMVINTLIITTVRDEVIDITFPFDESKILAVYRADTPDVGWLSVLKPLKVKQ